MSTPNPNLLKILSEQTLAALSLMESGTMIAMSEEAHQRLLDDYGPYDFIVGDFLVRRIYVASKLKPEHSPQSAHALYEMHELKDNLDRLEHAVTELRVELTRATACLMSHAGATKNDIDKLGCKIMSAISEWKTKVDQTFDEIDTKLDVASGKLTGLTDDVAFLKETIEKLQTNPGPITPEDQALLDAAQARVNSLSAKTAAVSAALEALDAATERPVAPPVPV